MNGRSFRQAGGAPGRESSRVHPARGQAPFVSPAEAMRVYDMLYCGAWYLMGGQQVLGGTRQAMRSAYEACLVEGTAPLFWLEMPLMGRPHSDLHVSYDFREVGTGVRFAVGDGLGYRGLFDWFAAHGRPGTGIDYTLDLCEEGMGAVGAYVSFHDASVTDLEGFCASIGRAGDAGRCRSLVEAFPPGWRVWYASPFPGREGNPVRAAGLASEQLKQAFARDHTLVREHFAQMGLAPLPGELCHRVSALAALPISLELRVGMNEDGSMCDRFDVSFYLSQGHLYPADRARLFGEGDAPSHAPASSPSAGSDELQPVDGRGTGADGACGVGWRALSWFEEWGISDARWHDLATGGFSKVAPFVRDDGTSCRVALLCSPTCFMMPWQAGEPLAAKAYPKLQGYLI